MECCLAPANVKTCKISDGGWWKDEQGLGILTNLQVRDRLTQGHDVSSEALDSIEPTRLMHDGTGLKGRDIYAVGFEKKGVYTCASVRTTGDKTAKTALDVFMQTFSER